MSNLEEARKLKQTLLNEYGHFSNKRITKLDVGSRLIVDGRTINDIGANGQIYSSFCSMFLDVLSGDEVLLSWG